MADREVDGDPVRRAAVIEEHLHGVADVALVGIEIVLRVLLVLGDLHLFAQRIDAWIRGNVVFIVGSGQAAEDQRYGNHVLDAVVAIGRIVERAGLVDDAHTGFLRLDDDFFYVVDTVFHLCVQRHRGFDGRLRVELRRVGDLEQHVLHDVAAVTALERERLTLEQHVVVAPGLCRQRGRVPHLTRHRDQREAYCAAGRIAGRPTLSRSRVRRMAVSAQRTTIDPCV